jgi:hypothetical protein
LKPSGAVFAGISLFVIGSVLLILSLFPQPKENLQLLYDFERQQRLGLDPPAWEFEIPLDANATYKFELIHGVSQPKAVQQPFNITNPIGTRTQYAFETEKIEILQVPYPGYIGQYFLMIRTGSFATDITGNYSFSVVGFFGKPYIIMRVFSIQDCETLYPLESLRYLGFGLIGSSIAVPFVYLRLTDKSRADHIPNMGATLLLQQKICRQIINMGQY